MSVVLLLSIHFFPIRVVDETIFGFRSRVNLALMSLLRHDNLYPAVVLGTGKEATSEDKNVFFIQSENVMSPPLYAADISVSLEICF